MPKKRPMLWFEEPFDEFRRTQEDFFRNMQDMFRKPFMARNLRFPEIRANFIPIKIGEMDEQIVLRAELPGFSKDDIKLKVTPKSIYISAEKKKQSIEKDKNFFRVEKGFNSLSRIMNLPEEVKTEAIKAKFENGFLEVIMPKKEVKKEKEVKID